jgi:hypothetical protein
VAADINSRAIANVRLIVPGPEAQADLLDALGLLPTTRMTERTATP